MKSPIFGRDFRPVAHESTSFGNGTHIRGPIFEKSYDKLTKKLMKKSDLQKI